MTVARAPKIITRFNDLDVFCKEKAQFMCKVKGDPKPDVTWYYDKQPLTVCTMVLCKFQVYLNVEANFHYLMPS